MKKFVTYDPNPQASPQARGKRAQSLRKLARLSRREFAERYAIPAGTLQNWEVAKLNGLTEKGALKLISSLADAGVYCSFEWLMHGVGPGPETAEQLYTEWVQPPAGAPSCPKPKEIIQQELLAFSQHHGANSTLLKVKDDGMIPYYAVNDYVAGIRRYQEQIKTLINLDCIVQTAGGEKLLRLLKPGSSEGLYTLVCRNYQTTLRHPILYDIELISAAPVIWIRRLDPTYE